MTLAISRVTINLSKSLYIQGIDSEISISGYALNGPVPLGSILDLILRNSAGELILQNSVDINQTDGSYSHVQAFGGLLPGIYSITASTMNLAMTAWFTYVKTDSWTTPTFPIETTWGNQVWTLTQDRVLNCSAGGDWVALTFPTPGGLAVTQTATINSMAFRYNLLKATGTSRINMDLVIVKSHKGLKFYLSGTQNTPRTVNIQVQSSSPIVKRLDRIYIGGLVFDFSDLTKTGIAFSYSNGVLSISAGTSFFLDPYIFESDFETGDFTGWSDYGGDGGNTFEVIAGAKNSGVYGAHFKTIGTSGAHCYYNWAGPTTLYIRAYNRMLDWPDSTYSQLWHIYAGTGSTPNNQVCILYAESDGHYLIAMWNGSDYTQQVESSSTYSTADFHCIEIKIVISASVGQATLYIDGIDQGSTAQVNNSGFGPNIVYVDMGIATSEETTELYLDDVVFDSSYIGPGVAYEISGVTYDKNGDILVECDCYLFKDNLDDTLTFIDYVQSDGATGEFTFTVADDDAQYLVVAFEDGVPHVFDVTDHVLQGIEV